MLLQVQVHPRNAAAAVHDGIDAPADFDSRSFVNTVTSDTGVQPPGLVPADIYPVVDARTDRLHSTRVQSFSAKVHRVCFANALSAGQVEVAGTPPRVAATSNWDPLRWARATTLWALPVAIVGVACLRYIYTDRHEWFARCGDANVVLSFAAIAGACLISLIVAFTVLRSRTGQSIAASALAASVVATALAFLHAWPSAASARAALARGAFDDARLEANAMVELGVDVVGGRAVLDELQSRLIAAAHTCRDIAGLVRYKWHSSTLQDAARETLRTCAVRDASAAYAQGDEAALAALSATVADFNLAEDAGIQWLAAVLHVVRALAADDVGGASASLARVASFANAVPPTMRAPTHAQLTEAAASLREALEQTDSKSLRTQRQAWTAAIERATAYVALTPVKDQVTAGLSQRLEAVRRKIAKADRKAAERVGDSGENAGGANAGATEPAQPTTAEPSSSDGVLNPY